MLQKVFLTTLVMTILVVLLISPLQSRASEEESGQPVCTITLRMQYNGQDLDSGELGIYTVARLLTDGSDYRYVYTGQFKNFENFTQDRMTAEKLTEAFRNGTLNNEVLSKQLQEYVNTQKTGNMTSVSVENGQAVFGEDLHLTPGLYLIIQNESQASEGFLPLDPFLITAPGMENGSPVYNVTAVPKTSLVPKDEPPGDNPPPPDNPPSDNPPGDNPPPETPPTPPTPPEAPPEIPSNRSVLGAMRPIGRVLGARRLPQTGQLWWPVPVMFAAGLILVLIGRRIRKQV